MQVVYVHPVLDRIVAELAGGSVGKPGLDPAARHPDRAAVRAVVATVPLLDDRRAADKRNKSYRGPGRNSPPLLRRGFYVNLLRPLRPPLGCKSHFISLMPIGVEFAHASFPVYGTPGCAA